MIFDVPGHVTAFIQFSLQFTHNIGLLLHVYTLQLKKLQFSCTFVRVRIPVISRVMTFLSLHIAVNSVCVFRGKLSTMYLVDSCDIYMSGKGSANVLSIRDVHVAHCPSIDKPL